MAEQRLPDMSVVIVTLENFDHIRKIIHRLQDQTVKNKLEILIITPSAERLAVDVEAMAGFHSFHVIETGSLTSAPQARTAGVRQASAPLIVYAEDHSFPEPNWAAALIDAFQQNYSVVGAIMVNGNPDTRVSWASFILNFGSWADPAAAGPISNTASHNSAYRRKDLLAYGDQLATVMASEIVMQWELRAVGKGIYLAAGARTHHVNVSRLWSYIQEQFHGGREFGAARSHSWPVLHRIAYMMGSPLIPLVRMRRALQMLRRPFWRERLPWGTLPLLILGVTLHSMGEMLSYAFGAGGAHQKGCDLEFRRFRHVIEQDLSLLREVNLERT